MNSLREVNFSRTLREYRAPFLLSPRVKQRAGAGLPLLLLFFLPNMATTEQNLGGSVSGEIDLPIAVKGLGVSFLVQLLSPADSVPDTLLFRPCA